MKSGTNITRILYFFVVGDKAILTNGFIKKTNKTPKKEIELAFKRKNDYNLVSEKTYGFNRVDDSEHIVFQ